MATNQHKLQIIIDAQNKASAALTDVSKGLDKFKSKVESFEPAFKKMAVAGTAVAAGMGLAIRGLVKEGLASQQISESFSRMTTQMGYSGDELISKLKEASAQTVDTTSLMLASNKAMALGVGTDIETMTTLMEIARVKGRALGMDTTQAFNDIVTGIGRGSPLILDNLGITIKLGEAQERYAEKLGKTVEEMTDAEKSQALLNAVITDGRKELAAIGEVTLTSAERMQQLSARFADMRSKVGEAFLPILEKLVDKLAPFLDRLAEWIDKNPELAAKIMLVVTGIAALVGVLGTIGLILPKVILGFQMVMVAVGAISLPVLAVIAAIAALIAIGVALYKNWDEVKAKASEIWNAIKSVFISVWEGIKTAFETYVYFIVGLVALMLDLIFPNWEEGLAKMAEVWTMAWEGMKAFFVASWDFLKGMFSAMTPFFKGLWEGVLAIFNWAKEELGKVFSWIDEKVQPIFRLLDKLISKLRDVGAGVKSALGSVVEKGKSVLGGRAAGGPVIGGGSYLVGEKGPEIFTPATAGRISNGVGGQTIVLQLSGNTFMGREGIAEQIGGEIVKQLKYRMKLSY